MNDLIWGTQVYPTDLSISIGVNKKCDLGIFVGFHKYKDLIYVVKHKKHTVYSYSRDFWTADATGWKG